jgi:hypothetical protein
MTWLRAHPREAAGAALAALVLFWYEVFWLGSMRGQIEARRSAIPGKAQVLTRLTQVQRLAAELDQRLALIRSRQPVEGSVAVAVDSLVRRFHRGGPPPYIGRLKGRDYDGATEEELVDIRMEELGLRDLHDLLRSLEGLGPAVRLRKIEIAKRGDTAAVSALVAGLKVR